MAVQQTLKRNALHCTNEPKCWWGLVSIVRTTSITMHFNFKNWRGISVQKKTKKKKTKCKSCKWSWNFVILLQHIVWASSIKYISSTSIGFSLLNPFAAASRRCTHSTWTIVIVRMYCIHCARHVNIIAVELLDYYAAKYLLPVKHRWIESFFFFGYMGKWAYTSSYWYLHRSLQLLSTHLPNLYEQRNWGGNLPPTESTLKLFCTIFRAPFKV